SDDVYGRSKAYESIIKRSPIVGSKIPESFSVLVKEMQGLVLKVTLEKSDKVIDAEDVLATNVRDEAENQPELAVPAPAIPDFDVTEDAAGDEFMIMEGEVTDEEENIPASTDDIGGDD